MEGGVQGEHGAEDEETGHQRAGEPVVGDEEGGTGKYCRNQREGPHPKTGPWRRCNSRRRPAYGRRAVETPIDAPRPGKALKYAGLFDRSGNEDLRRPLPAESALLNPTAASLWYCCIHTAPPRLMNGVRRPWIARNKAGSVGI